MERFRVVTAFPMPGGMGVHASGTEVGREELAHANLEWLLKSGTIEPAGGVVPVSMLPENPTTADYENEVLRLQIELERLTEENDRLKREHSALKLSFPTGPQAVAADNVARRLADAEARANRAESRVRELTREVSDSRGNQPPAPHAAASARVPTAPVK